MAPHRLEREHPPPPPPPGHLGPMATANRLLLLGEPMIANEWDHPKYHVASAVAALTAHHLAALSPSRSAATNDGICVSKLWPAGFGCIFDRLAWVRRSPQFSPFVRELGTLALGHGQLTCQSARGRAIRSSSIPKFFWPL